MSYATGTFTTANQLLDAIRSFAAANGWTENAYAADGSGYKLLINKGSVYLNFRSLTAEASTGNGTFTVQQATGVACAISTGYAGGSAWNDQPGRIAPYSNTKSCSGIFNISASNTYHLFASASPDQLFCVAETSPGSFQFLGGGLLQKHGSYTGGEWLTGSFYVDGYTHPSSTNLFDFYLSGGNQNRINMMPFLDYQVAPGSWMMMATLVRAECDGKTGFAPMHYLGSTSPPTWTNFTGTVLKGIFEGRQINAVNYIDLLTRWYDYAPASLNGITPLLPFHLYAARPSGFWSPIGYPPHLRFLNMLNYAPGDLITLGSEQWMVFPGYIKSAALANRTSHLYGYAVRYEP